MACANGCLVSCVKVFLIVLNVIFLIIGAALLAGGIWMKVDINAITYMRILSTSPSSPVLNIISWVLIGVGAFIFVISFLGCCGTCCESHMMLYFYIVLLIIVMAAEITAAVLAYVYRNKVNEYLETTMTAQIKLHYNQSIPVDPDNTDALTAAWDRMQVKLKCCGAVGPKDYYNSRWYNETARPKMYQVPDTCCVTEDEDPTHLKPLFPKQCQMSAGQRSQYNGKQQPGGIGISLHLHTTGCKDAVLAWIQKHIAIISGVAGGILGLQILVLILSCCLLQHVRRKLEDYDF